MHLALIVAMSSNGVIGRNNKLPWHLPNDLRYFKQVTLSKPVIMGRKTFESIGRSLPGRTNIVISRNPEYEAEGVRVVGSLNEAVDLAKAVATIDGADELMVIGGEQVYAEAYPLAEKLYLTLVHAEIRGDSFFTAFEPGDWRELSRTDFSADETNPYDYSFVILQRCER
jgi:dihydrofolate reductase